MIKRYVQRFPYALSGIWHVMRHDFSYQMQVVLITPAILIFCYIFWPLTQSEILFLGLAYVLILITEIQNSAFEEAPTICIQRCTVGSAKARTWLRVQHSLRDSSLYS